MSNDSHSHLKRPRLKSTDDADDADYNWLSVVLNDYELDPMIDSGNYFEQIKESVPSIPLAGNSTENNPENGSENYLEKIKDSQESQHTIQNSEITFNNPFIFKSVNSAPNIVNGFESKILLRRQVPFISEDLVEKVVEGLEVILEEVKNDVWRNIMNVNQAYLLPASFLHEFNKLVNDSYLQSNNIKAPFIKSFEEFYHFISKMHIPSSLSSDVEFRNALNLFCQMASFITIVYMLFDTVVMDFLCENNEEILARRLSVNNFMDIFHDDDNFLKRNIPFDDQSPNASENLEAFTWYYRLVVRSQPQYQCNLSVRFLSLAIHFTSLEPIESILSILYTKHVLNVLAKELQKDHGQFYTPREVIRFMWDRVLIGKGNASWTEKLLGLNSGLYPNQKFNASVSSWGVFPQVPSVLDPCMGIGSFLCEFISRLTLAAQQCPVIWNNSGAIASLLYSLSVNLWGIEIDAFAYHFCKINIMLHILPLYKRFIHLTRVNDLKLARFHLFCNDTLNLYLPKPDFTWEYENLLLLRSPQRLKFDFIVTNPPYMIRKTGYVSEPDSELFDERVLGKGRMQAYAYFFLFCIERCKEEIGEVCLISASQWMGLEFADKLRAWIWQKCNLVEFFQFEPFKVWSKIQTDSLIFRLRRRSEPISSTSVTTLQPALTELPILFLRYMNRKATLQETLQAYSKFNPNRTQFEKDMNYQLSPPYPITQLPSSTNSYSFTFLMPSSVVSAYLHSITAHLPFLCDHDNMKNTWVESNPLIWHRGPNTNPVYALVVRTVWAYSKFGTEVCKDWLRPVFYWNGKNCGKEAEFWQKMGDNLRVEKKENSPAEAYVPFITNVSNSGEYDKTKYSLIMVDRGSVDKVRRKFSENSEFWKYLKEAREYLQTGFTSREVAYCGTNKCGIDVKTKIIHPINCGYFSKNQPRQRFFIDDENVCVTNQCIYFTIKSTTRLSSDFFLGMLNSTTIQHFLYYNCKYDQQGRMRLFRENISKIPYSAPTSTEGLNWFIKCVDKMILVRKLLYKGISMCDNESQIVENLRRGSWHLIGREWESNACNDEISIILSDVVDGNWVHVKQIRDQGDGFEYSGSESRQNKEVSTTLTQNISSAAERTHIMKPFFESLLISSAYLQYAIDQYVYTLYNINPEFQLALEKELKLELVESILNKFPRLTTVINCETKGAVPIWGIELLNEAENLIETGQNMYENQIKKPIL